jgi:hypothetical protein
MTGKNPARVLVFSLVALLAMPFATWGQGSPGQTFFQTNVPYDPMIALEADFVVVHQHAHPDIGSLLRTWSEAGWKTGRMFFIGSDANRVYTTGKWDGKEHLDEAETTREGTIIECAGVRPYMVPTEGWTRYVCEMVEQSIDAGAVAILPEEPLAHTRSGYSEGFKRIWRERYGTEWEEPHSSPNAFFKANRLKSDLYFELVEACLETTDRKAAEMGREVSFLLPIHSLLSHAAGQMLYASGRSVGLAEKGLDGFVGQVWTGPIRWSMSWAEGAPMDHEGDFFDCAYLLYSYFNNLVAGTEIPCYLLADPVEDDPQYTWEDYRKWYNHSLVSMLMFPEATHFEIMPWPDRVFLPGYHMASGTPGPEDYRRALQVAFAALNSLPEKPSTEAIPAKGSQVGVIVADTISWQRGGPEGSTLAGFHGTTIPLLRRGIPLQVVPLERHSDPEFLDRFKVLILSYDSQKPLDAEMNKNLAAWVRRGGQLVALGGADLYNKIESWWQQEGLISPLDHLWEELGIWKREEERFFFKGPRELDSVSTFFNNEGLNRLHVSREWVLTDYHFSGGKQIYSLEGKEGTPHCGVVSEVPAGEGRVLFCGLPAEWFGKSEQGGALIDRLTRYAGQGLLPVAPAAGPMMTQRGELVAVRTRDQAHRLSGRYLDLLDPSLPLLTDPEVPPRTSALYLDSSQAFDQSAEKPQLLFGGPTPVVDQAEATETFLSTWGPEGTPCTLRLAAQGRQPARVIVTRPSENADLPLTPIVQEWSPESHTLLLVIPGGVGKKSVRIAWEPVPVEEPEGTR